MNHVVINCAPKRGKNVFCDSATMRSLGIVGPVRVGTLKYLSCLTCFVECSKGKWLCSSSKLFLASFLTVLLIICAFGVKTFLLCKMVRRRRFEKIWNHDFYIALYDQTRYLYTVRRYKQIMHSIQFFLFP